VTDDDLMRIVRAWMVLPRQVRTTPAEWKRRLTEAGQQLAARMGLRDASKY